MNMLIIHANLTKTRVMQVLIHVGLAIETKVQWTVGPTSTTCQQASVDKSW